MFPFIPEAKLHGILETSNKFMGFVDEFYKTSKSVASGKFEPPSSAKKSSFVRSDLSKRLSQKKLSGGKNKDETIFQGKPYISSKSKMRSTLSLPSWKRKIYKNIWSAGSAKLRKGLKESKVPSAVEEWLDQKMGSHHGHYLSSRSKNFPITPEKAQNIIKAIEKDLPFGSPSERIENRAKIGVLKKIFGEKK